MAEGKQIRTTLAFNGDERLEDFIKRNFDGAKATLTNGKHVLEGNEYIVKKVVESFCPIDVGKYRKQLILTEDGTLRYLNDILHKDMRNFFLLTDMDSVYVSLPHKQRKAKHLEDITNLVKENILEVKIDKRHTNVSSKFESLLSTYPGKITIVDSSVLVFTKDIERNVTRYFDQLKVHYPSSKLTQITYPWSIDEGCKTFIETYSNCPDIKVQCDKSSFTLIGPNADQQIEVFDLDIDLRKKQLILTGDDSRPYINEQLQRQGVICYLILREKREERTIIGIFPSSCKVEMSRVCNVIHENICVLRLDNQEDSNYEEQLLIGFDGKITFLVEQGKGSYIVFTKDIESEVTSSLEKMRQDAEGKIKVTSSPGVSENNDVAMKNQNQPTSMKGTDISKHGYLTQSKGPGSDRYNTESDGDNSDEKSGSHRTDLWQNENQNWNKDGKRHHRGKDEKYQLNREDPELDTEGNKGKLERDEKKPYKGDADISRDSSTSLSHPERRRKVTSESEGNEIESSCEVIYSDVILMDADLAEYLFTRKKSEIQQLEKDYKCSIDKDGCNIIISGSGLTGSRRVFDNDKGSMKMSHKGQKDVIDKVNELARTFCTNSFYIEEEKFKACQSNAFQRVIEHLRRDETVVSTHPCNETKIVDTFWMKGTAVCLVQGSAADVQKTEALLCPLDSKLNPVCAAACHIMHKGGEFLRETCTKFASDPIKSKRLKSLSIHTFSNTGNLPVQLFCAMIFDDWYMITQSEDDADITDTIEWKFREVLGLSVSKRCKSLTVPIELGQKIPVSLIAKAFCNALKSFIRERPNSVLKTISLCVVNECHFPSLTELLRREFPTEGRGPAIGPSVTRDVTATETQIYGPSTVQVTLDTGSLTDQRVEAIVVPANSMLDLTQGAISYVVLKAAGHSIQDELNKTHHQGIGPMEATHSGPGKLPVKFILYSNLPLLNDNYGPPEERVSLLMAKIFKLAKKLKVTSLALPALGTGGLKYPDEPVAREMVRSIYLHASRCDVKRVNIVVYKPSSEQHKIFEDVVKLFHGTVKRSCKSIMDNPLSVEITDLGQGQIYEITSNSSEIDLCDVIIHHRETRNNYGVTYPCDDFGVRKMETKSDSLVREKIYLRSLSRVDDNSKIYQKALEYALRTRHCQFLVIDLASCIDPEETKVIILRLLKKLDNVLDKDNRLGKLQFLVCDEALQSCVKHAQEQKDEPSKKDPDSFISKIKGVILSSAPDLVWGVRRSKIYSAFGAHVVVCSESEQKLQSAIFTIKKELSSNKTVRCRELFKSLWKKEKMLKESSDGNKHDAGRSSGSQQTTAERTHPPSDGNFTHKIPTKPPMDKQPVQRLNDGRSRQNRRNDPAPDRPDPLNRTPSQRSNSDENDVPYADDDAEPSNEDAARRDNGRYKQHPDRLNPVKNTSSQRPVSDENDDAYAEVVADVKALEEFTAVLPTSIVRHMSSRQIKEFLKECEAKNIKAKPIEKGIQVSVSYDKRGDLAEVLKSFMSHIKKGEYYVHSVQPELFHILRLYFLKTGKIQDNEWRYSESNQEILVYKYEDCYSEVKAKAELFQNWQYKIDTLDVSKTKISVERTLNTLDDDNDPYFEHILVEAINNNQTVNIHYPLNEQDKALKVKHSLQVKLELIKIKTTGRRNRRFGDYTSLQMDNPQITLQNESEPSMVQSKPDYSDHKRSTMQSSVMSTRTYSMPAPSNIPLQQYTDHTVTAHDGLSEGSYCTEKGLVIKVYKGDITKLSVECIVNAANEQLFHGAGIAAVIARAAGRDLDRGCQDFIRDNGSLHVNQCISTVAGKLPYKYVLHAVGPMWGMYKDKRDCEDELMMTIVNILLRAECLKMTSVAIPSISSGIFGVPWDVCAQQYARGVQRFEEESQNVVKQVHFIDINEKILREIKAVFRLMFKVQTSSDVGEEIV